MKKLLPAILASVIALPVMAHASPFHNRDVATASINAPDFSQSQQKRPSYVLTLTKLNYKGMYIPASELAQDIPGSVPARDNILMRVSGRAVSDATSPKGGVAQGIKEFMGHRITDHKTDAFKITESDRETQITNDDHIAIFSKGGMRPDGTIDIKVVDLHKILYEGIVSPDNNLIISDPDVPGLLQVIRSVAVTK